MLRLSALLAALAVIAPGCSFTSGLGGDGGVHHDAPTDGPRVDGRTDGAIDAAVDAAIDGPPGDTDGDGFPDVSDNCPSVPNPDQRDHDGDGHGDVCDRCPHLFDLADPDGDGDGVGDACDPRPATAGDHRALWDGFYGPAIDSTLWVAKTGSWTIAAGHASQVSTAGVGLLQSKANFANPYVMAATTVQALASGAGLTDEVGVTSGVVAATQFYDCKVSHLNTTTVLKVAGQWSGNSASASNAWTGTFAVASTYALTQRVTGSLHTCIATEALKSVTTSAVANGGTNAGAVGLLTRSLAADFDYVFIVEIGP
jgi:hypothetical protein